jgi:hypothetical protein
MKRKCRINLSKRFLRSLRHLLYSLGTLSHVTPSPWGIKRCCSTQTQKPLVRLLLEAFFCGLCRQKQLHGPIPTQWALLNIQKSTPSELILNMCDLILDICRKCKQILTSQRLIQVPLSIYHHVMNYLGTDRVRSLRIKTKHKALIRLSFTFIHSFIHSFHRWLKALCWALAYSSVS